MKKWISLLMCMALLLGLAGCSGNYDPTEPPPDGISDDQLGQNPGGDPTPVQKELELAELEKISYDKDGREVDNLFYYGSTEEHRTYTYDENGNCTETKLTVDDTEKERYVRTYDEKGNMTGETVYREGGKVKISTFEYDEAGNVAADSVWEKGRTKVGKYTYDEEGVLLESVFTVDEAEVERYVNQHNEDGLLIQDVYYMDGEESSRTEYTYDENGNETLMVQYSDGEPVYRHVYAYNENGDMTEDAYYTAEGDLLYRYLMEYTYHTGNRVNTVHTYDNPDTSSTSGGTLMNVMTYSETGGLLSEASYEEGELADQAYYTYDDSGNLVEEKYLWYTQGEGYTEYRTVCTFNGDGQVLTETTWENGVETLRDEYTYGDTGWETQRKRYENGLLISRQTQEYDENGNLIQRELYQEKKN